MLAELGIDLPTAVMLGLALLLALGFEFVNGFHDTANAVATVIYTKSLKPVQAVIWSGSWNFIGVLTSSGAVAFGVVALLPVELVLNVGSGAGFAMVFALLLSAIIWNLGTWYLGLPASSSHTLIGSIVGVGLMNSYLSAQGAFGDGVNWGKVADTGKALLFSPIIGFVLAALLLLLARAVIKNAALFKSPDGETPPPWPVRALLVATCTGVSFAHGSNDGQKGMGLIMLILIGAAPIAFALDGSAKPETLQQVEAGAMYLQTTLGSSSVLPATAADATAGADAVGAKIGGTPPANALEPDPSRATLIRYLRQKQFDSTTLPALGAVNGSIAASLEDVPSLAAIPSDVRRGLRSDLYLVSESLSRMGKAHQLPATLDAKKVGDYTGSIKKVTNYIPTWVKFAVALALGMGTMIGWKRIVVTVGEKIGKAHLTYAQGASAELVAFATIEAADILGLPVSTTHVLSSGIAGTMVANGSGLQKETVRNILLAWVLTLPVCVLLGAGLFAAGLFLVFRVFGLH
jgi:PiT family inorganic phosphate transporter